MRQDSHPADASGMTQARRHPELTHGDFATPPPRLRSAARPARPRSPLWRGALLNLGTAAVSLLVGFGVGAAVMVAEPSSGTAPPTPTHESHLLACAQADGKAVETLVHRLRGETDADLRQAADTLFRLRRARRNCRAGWVALAHADYRAIEQSAQRAASEPKPR